MRISRVTGDPLSGHVTDENGRNTAVAFQTYSAVMDMDTCDACARWDGRHFRLNATSVQIPNPECTCAEGCRCCWTLVTRDEFSTWPERDRNVPLLP